MRAARLKIIAIALALFSLGAAAAPAPAEDPNALGPIYVELSLAQAPIDASYPRVPVP